MCEDAKKLINVNDDNNLENDCSCTSNLLEPDARIAELVLVSSMYPGQLNCLDAIVQSALDNENYNINFNQSIDAIFTVDELLQVHIVLPLKFPQQKLQVHCRIVNTGFDKKLQTHLNDELKVHSTLNNLLEVILTINQLWSELDKKPAKENKSDKEQNDEDVLNNKILARFWIYSHHIKSSIKRKLIVDLCKQLNLNGFMLIGKPGFICVEGSLTDCEEFWSNIRSLTWQRITLIESEKLSINANSLTTDTIFESFQEWQDRSAIFRALKEKNCDSILKNFLGMKN